jgi:hypothetical protein
MPDKTINEKNARYILKVWVENSPEKTWRSLLSNHEGVCVGEHHDSLASKKFLVDNMALLKDEGVDTIYLEHIFADTQGEMLKEYFKKDGLEMPLRLARYLESLTAGHFNRGPKPPH